MGESKLRLINQVDVIGAIPTQLILGIDRAWEFYNQSQRVVGALGAMRNIARA